MIQYCKYRLPCNWCDKFDKYCDMVEPIKIEIPDANECDHDWKIEERFIYQPIDKNEEPYYRIKRVCHKCHTVEMVDMDMNGNYID